MRLREQGKTLSGLTPRGAFTHLRRWIQPHEPSRAAPGTQICGTNSPGHHKEPMQAVPFTCICTYHITNRKGGPALPWTSLDQPGPPGPAWTTLDLPASPEFLPFSQRPVLPAPVLQGQGLGPIHQQPQHPQLIPSLHSPGITFSSYNNTLDFIWRHWCDQKTVFVTMSLISHKARESRAKCMAARLQTFVTPTQLLGYLGLETRSVDVKAAGSLCIKFSHGAKPAAKESQTSGVHNGRGLQKFGGVTEMGSNRHGNLTSTQGRGAGTL